MAYFGSSLTAPSSGLTASNINTLIQQTLAAQRQPIQVLNAQKAALDVEKAVYADLKSKMSALEGVTENLISDEEDTVFDDVRATTSASAVVTVSATSSALNGNYTVDVETLAEAHRVSSGGGATSASADLGLVGTFTLNGADITIAADDSLEDIVDAINAAEYGESEGFSVNSTYETELDSGTVSADLRADFLTNGITLSEDATVSTQTATGRWLITDHGNKYSVRDTGTQLDIYKGGREVAATIVDNHLVLEADSTGTEFRLSFTGDTSILKGSLAGATGLGILDTNDNFTGSSGSVTKLNTETSWGTATLINSAAPHATDELASGLYTIRVTDSTVTAFKYEILDENGVKVSENTAGVNMTNTSTATNLTNTAGNNLGINLTLGDITGTNDYDFEYERDAEDAEFAVNGINIKRSFNTGLDDVMDGVTLNLLSVGEAEVRVTQNYTAISAKIRAFVDNLNGTVSYLNAKIATTVDKDNDTYTRGTLAGKTIFSMLKMNLIAALGEQVAGRSLADIGITVGDGLEVSLDTSKLNTELETNFDGAVQLFDGVMEEYLSILEPYTATSSNRLDIYSGAVDTRMENIDSRVERMEKMLEIKEEMLIKQYSGLYMQSMQIQDQQQSLLSIYSGFSTYA